MKKRWYIFFLLMSIIIISGINHFIILEYNINLLKYIEYSKDFTNDEINIIKKYTPIVYGGNINEPPLGMYYQENGQYVGLVVDHMSALSIQLGETIISRPMIWENAMEALKNGETDLCDMIPSKERAKYYEFTDPIYSLSGAVAVKKGNENLVEGKIWKDVIIGIQKSDYALEHIDKLVKKENIRYTNDVKDAILLLEKGEVDAVVGDEPVIKYYLNELKYRDSYQIIPKSIYKDNCALAVPKSEKELVPILNKAIFMLKKNGTIEKINNKWIPSIDKNFTQDTEKLKLAMQVILLITFITAYTVYMWNRSLKNLVNIKTKELENTKNELEVTFNAIKEYIVIIDAKGSIKNINKAFLNSLDSKLIEFVNLDYRTIHILDDFELKNDEVIRKILDKNTINQQETFTNQYELKTTSGIYRIKIYPLEYEAHIIERIAIMIEDITHQKLNQEKLTQENKMSAIGQLAAGVAHELRNPLGIIRNSTFLLNESWDDQPMRSMAIESIDSAIDRSSKIINNLLSFSRKNPDSFEDINIREIVSEVCKFFKSSIPRNKIKLNYNIDKDLVINTNSTSLRHIMMNLIQNSIDAIKSEGNVEIRAYYENDNLIVQVEDDGEGIKEDEKTKIFEPFYTTKDIGKGTGLGLYIVYTEVSKINGEITVDSVEQKTVFTLKIPLFSSNFNKIGDETDEL